MLVRFVDAVPPEPEREGLADQKETGRRLAESLCVWCADQIGDDANDPTFCGQDCQWRWGAATRAKLTGEKFDPYSEVSTRAQFDGPAPSDRDMMPDPGPAPGWMGGPIYRAERPTADLMGGAVAAAWREIAEAYLADLREGGVEFVAGVGLPRGWEYALTGSGEDSYVGLQRIPERPGVVVTGPMDRGAGVGDPGRFDVGPLRCDYDVRLRAIEPEREAEPPFPADKLRDLLREGWRVAEATRWCVRCEATTKVIIQTRSWPMPYTIEPREVAAAADPARISSYRSKACCGRCHVPHPDAGSGMVPLRRAPRHHRVEDTEFAVLHPSGRTTHMRVTTEALECSAVGLMPMLWRDLHEGVQWEAYPWGCALPGCEGKGHSWVALGARMVWGGHEWGPRDEEPVRMGLCGEHYARLRRDVFTYPDGSRAGLSLVGQREQVLMY